MREDPVVAVAGLVVGLESQVPSIYRKQTPTLRDKYGFSDEEVEFFDLHIVSDEIHGERGYQIVLEHATTVEMQQRCIKICEVGARCACSTPPRSTTTTSPPSWPPPEVKHPRSAWRCAFSRRLSPTPGTRPRPAP
ncbi:Pyrroloquinoline quinone (Coenzyme PQQ) biosynthesis protein C [Hydrogenophaga sp. T4]|nr:Pyrroloquinoline quinone (Coenzyme PQQ) biosynthesis protein C [Hydrogenophaga sp. T4]